VAIAIGASHDREILSLAPIGRIEKRKWLAEKGAERGVRCERGLLIWQAKTETS
jgi:hypothetical protein